MPDAKTYGAPSRTRLTHLVKQYNDIKGKQRRVEIDDKQPIKQEMFRLQSVRARLHKDHKLIDDLPDRIAAVADEWSQNITELSDEEAKDAANQQFVDFKQKTSWDDIQNTLCDELLHHLSVLMCSCEALVEDLSAKLSETNETSSSASNAGGDQNRQGNVSADNAGNPRGRVNQPADNAGGFSEARHSWAPFSGGATGHFRQNQAGADPPRDDHTAVDPRTTHRFYHGITLPPERTADEAMLAAAIPSQVPPCPMFDGKITEYNTFRDRFINAVEAGHNLTDRDKMAVLLQHLSGKPARICTGFPISDANYWRVLTMLVDEYDHQEELEQILLQQLYRLPAPRDSRHDLNEFYIDASRILRQLEDMQSDINTRDVLQALQSKLPRHILSSVLRAKKPGSTWNTTTLMDRLHGEVQHAREVGRILQPDTLGGEEQPPTRPRIECIESTIGTAAFATWNQHTDRSSSNRKPPADNAGVSGCCAFCDGTSHASARCTRFTTREQRLTRALYQGICPKCCSRQPRPHLAADCPHADQGCYHCRRSGHHLAFCIKYLAQFNDRIQRARPQNNFRKNPTRGRSPPPRRSYAAASNNEVAIPGELDTDDEYGANPPLSEEEQRALDAELDSDNETEKISSVRVGYSVLANQTNGNHHTKLLECTKAHVFNRTTGHSEDIVVFFDSGSDTTFVDQDLADRLNLPDQGREVLKVDTFASKGVKTPVPVMLTCVGVLLINGSTVDLQAKAGSGIIGNIHSALIDDKDVPLLRANKCAIIASNERPLMLIGRDQQHLFRKRDDDRLLPSGFCLVNTLLGPVLAGMGTVKTVTWASELTAATQPYANAAAEMASRRQCGGQPAVAGSADAVSSRQCRDRSVAATAFRIVVDDSHPLSDEMLAQRDENYWKTDNIGITLPEQGPEDELVFRRHCERLTREEDGRYVTPIPWRTPDGQPVGNDVLKPNYGLALGRLDTILKQQPPEVLRKIDENFKAQEAADVIARVDPRERNNYTKHYLASQVVVKESSNTTKLRIVYDASAGSGRNTKSLNDCTHRGPVLIPNLPGMLLRSRLSAIVITTDLEKAYLQLGLPPEDRDVCRFLWLKDIEKPLCADNLVVYRFQRVTFGLKSAPFMLAGTLYHHLDSYGTPLAAEIKRNCYVDNVVLAADSVEQALEKYKQTKAIFADAKMNAREFASNSKELLAQIPKDDVSDSVDLFHSLGVNWDFTDDCWVMPLNCRSTRKPQGKQAKRALEAGTLTRRQMSSRLQSIYDPKGLAAPALIAAKLTIQRTYVMQHTWDTPVPDDIRKLWEAATEDWDATTIRIQRRVAPCSVHEPEIHVFVDACKDAYGIATYLRIYDENAKRYHVTLIFSRAKVKPAKDVEKLTIPDMELMAMALGARNVPYIIENLGTAHKAVYLWSDSMINLQRVVTPGKQKTVWVQNRLEEIRKLQEDHGIRLRHVSTEHNPADIVSRGIPAAQLQSSQLWWHGAPFLSEPDEAWKAQPEVLPLEQGRDQPPTDVRRPADNAGAHAGRMVGSFRTRSDFFGSTKFAVAFRATQQPTKPRTATPLPTMPAEPLVDLASTNDYQKLLRKQALVLKAAAAFWRVGVRSSAEQRHQRTLEAFGFDLGERFLGGALCVNDIVDAETLMFRKAQLRHPPPIDTIRSLGLVPVGHLLRAKGRLQHATSSESEWPIYTPREARETHLLIADYHHRNGHAGAQTTLANVRQRFWFTHGRRTVSSVIAKNCWPCRRFDAKPFQAPLWPPLPAYRVQPGRPFSAVGIDFFGPINLKMKNSDGSTYTRKHWVVIFACMIVRAIHTEIVETMDTEAFIRALNRFAGRRGLPHTILSDNGKQLLAARSILHELQPPVEEAAADNAAPSDRLEQYLLEKRIRWTAITEVAPWRGGTYERLIGPVKNCLRRSIGSGKPLLARDDFETLLIGAEAIVNSRPLTHVPDTTNEFRVIRPKDFLIPVSSDDSRMDASFHQRTRQTATTTTDPPAYRPRATASWHSSS
ncbi:Pao retrotransposon peptidase family protein [Aphelenchoides avenae]|nr:Pao retrotransposon peptidase family protein [Aphelenchus avenae]